MFTDSLLKERFLFFYQRFRSVSEDFCSKVPNEGGREIIFFFVFSFSIRQGFHRIGRYIGSVWLDEKSANCFEC